MPSSHWHFLCWARFTILAQEAAAKAAGLVAYARGAGPAQGKLPASPPLEADDLLRVWVAITTETENNSDIASERPPECGIHRHSRGRAWATRATGAGDPAARTLIDISGRQAK